jgi:enoyl-CoA hydratase/carnithine racemase
VTEVVLRERIAPHIELVTLNRPEARNAVNAAVAEGLGAVVADTEADPDIWAVILTGAGGVAFSAGADLREVSQGGMTGLYTPQGGFAGLVEARRMKPWIAAVDGFALAGGFELVLACDLAVASRTSAFGLPEVSRGLVAAAGGVYRLARALPRALALELIATGARIDATRAMELGLVNRVTESGAAVAAAQALAEAICANAPLAVRESLAIARQAVDLEDRALMALSIEAQRRLSQTEDFAEGPRAFLERRAPSWTGR